MKHEYQNEGSKLLNLRKNRIIYHLILFRLSKGYQPPTRPTIDVTSAAAATSLTPSPPATAATATTPASIVPTVPTSRPTTACTSAATPARSRSSARCARTVRHTKPTCGATCRLTPSRAPHNSSHSRKGPLMRELKGVPTRCLTLFKRSMSRATTDSLVFYLYLIETYFSLAFTDMIFKHQYSLRLKKIQHYILSCYMIVTQSANPYVIYRTFCST